MNKLDRGDEVTKWLTRPLCCRYVGVFLRSVPVRFEVEGAETSANVIWALGWHAECGPDLLGAWHQDGMADQWVSALFTDMHERGIERIAALIGDDFSDLSACGVWDARSQPRAPLRPVEVAASLKLSSVCSSDRRMLLAADTYVRDLERRLKAAVRRRSTFANSSDAMSFLVARFQREERKLDKLVRLPTFPHALDGLACRIHAPRSAPLRDRAAPTLQ